MSTTSNDDNPIARKVDLDAHRSRLLRLAPLCGLAAYVAQHAVGCHASVSDDEDVHDHLTMT